MRFRVKFYPKGDLVEITGVLASTGENHGWVQVIRNGNTMTAREFKEFKNQTPKFIYEEVNIYGETVEYTVNNELYTGEK